ncbi:alkaline phosphatase [Desulfobacter postgatei]|uniref:alkaline phosphatase n=1 Tax=Desulfobacter postgatei TaxID=2293 RepID=UPI002A35EE08|nr:alkaline phosphatase [Desulfobacter postgatei]MDX9964011.1 alkaline phosphatase [Desulfobacter postgatei]
MKKIGLAVVFVTTMFTLAATAAFASNPKYVFFFLGDGMANAQIQATEAYLTTANGDSATLATDLQKSENRLNMTQMPVHGMQMTYDAYALMTDSASSATAFSCGIKTKSGVINMNSEGTVSYKSIAQLAHEKGMKVGVISSVSLDHATPAAYYASVASRNNYADIEIQLAESGYEFFGGGGMKKYDTDEAVQTAIEENGYTILNDRESIMALNNEPMDKVICINPWLQDSSAMPYAIDRPETNVSLAEMTQVAISVLHGDNEEQNNKNSSGQNSLNRFFFSRQNSHNGFFLMVEGGKIDWACHANDAMAAIGDTLAFDDAVGVALEFYKKYPNDTLIIVTGDHETGGMTIGHATTKYGAHYEKLLGQTNSFVYFDEEELPKFDCRGSLSADSDMLEKIYEKFGLVYSELNDYQKEKLDDAYVQSVCEGNTNSEAKNTYLYGGYEALTVTLTHILNENASIGWTSYSHTGVPVSVFATGADAELFNGFYDNTDIAKKIAKALNIHESLPVLK